jgi:hypothetical protein
MNPIPPQATNLELDFSFEASGEHRHFSWPSPLAQFPTGQIVMDIRGVWPNGPTVTERATGEQG